MDRAFGIDIHNPLADLMDGGYSMGILVVLIVALLLAIVSLVLPFALRTSRMMWIVIHDRRGARHRIRARDHLTE